MTRKITSFWALLTEAFHLPKQYRSPFKTHVAVQNRNRFRIALPIILILSALISSYLYFNHYLAYPDVLLKSILTMHGVLMGATALTLILLMLMPKDDNGVSRYDSAIQRSFLVFGLFWTMFFSLNSQVYSDQITVFQFGTGFIAIIALMTPAFSLFAFGSVTLTFIALIPLYQPDAYLMTSDIINSIYLFFLSMCVTFILYRNNLKDFLLNAKIHEQNKELTDLNRQLEELSNRDSLTGIHNRRFFDKKVKDEWQSATQNGRVLSVAIMDIDDFKAYNDLYGHLQGDTVLKAVVECIQTQAKRPTDILARFGGEEFVLLLPNTDEPGAKLLCERIRHAVSDLHIAHERSDTGQLTISIGICTLTPELDQDFISAIKQADAALYEAKKQGKNKVVQSS